MSLRVKDLNAQNNNKTGSIAGVILLNLLRDNQTYE